MRLTNPFSRQPYYVVRDAGSGVPEFDMTAFMKTVKLPAVALDFPNAYRLVSAIYFCVNLVADAVASTPLRFFTEGANGEKVYQKPKKGNVAGLWGTANGEDTGRDLIFGIAASRALFGDGDLFFEDFLGDMAPAGEVQGLYLMNPLGVEIKPGRNRTIAGWRVKDGAQWRDLARHKIEHFPRFDPRFGRVPVSPLEPLIVEYEAIYDAMRVVRNLSKNSFVPPGFFSTKGGLPDDLRKRIGRQIRRMLDRLLKRQNDAMILPNDIKFEGAALSIADMQLTELERMVMGKVLRAFRIPPTYAGINEGSGLNSDTMKSARGLFHELVREPECSAIAEVMNERVLPRLATGIQCEFDFSKILAVQEQKIDAATKIVTLTGAPILTRNEGREWIGMIPIDEADADQLLQPMAMLTAEDRDDMAAASTEAGTDAAAADEKKGAAEPKRSLSSMLEQHRDRRAHLRVRNQRSLARHERSMKRGWLRVFGRQRARVKARVREQFEERGLATDWVSAFDQRALNLDDLLRDDAGDERIIRRLIRAVVEEQGQAAIAEISLELAFTMTGTVKQWILDNSARSIRETSETTRDRLRISLGQGVENNEGLGELVARVDAVFDGRRGNAATIARTETAGSYNYATIEGWDQSGEVESKEWLSAHDDVVRESHREADGQVVPLDQPFSVDGESVEFPGDPSVSPENRCNCRCSVLPVLRQRVIPPGTYTPEAIRRRINGVFHTNGNGKPKRSVEEWLSVKR